MSRTNKSKSKRGVKATPPVTSAPVVLTSQEVCFLRDLMGVLFPIEMVTVSADLAEKTDRQKIEQSVWDKICLLCNKMSIPVGEMAPDFVIAPKSAPMMGVFELSEKSDDSGDMSSVFEGEK